MGSKFSKKFQTPAIWPKTISLLAHCFDSSQTIIDHLFYSQRDILNNILTTARDFVKMDFQKKINNSAIIECFYLKILWKLLQ